MTRESHLLMMMLQSMYTMLQKHKMDEPTADDGPKWDRSPNRIGGPNRVALWHRRGNGPD